MAAGVLPLLVAGLVALGPGFDHEQDESQALNHLRHGKDGGKLAVGNKVVHLGWQLKKKRI